MKTSASLIAISLIIAFCKAPNQKKVLSYRISKMPLPNEVLIDLEKIQSYKELIEEIENISCNDSIPILNYCSESNATKQIQLWHNCLPDTDFWYRKNILLISENQILNQRKYNIEYLDIQLHKHYNNHGKLDSYSDHPKKAAIEINYQEIQMDNLKNILENITEYHSNNLKEIPLILMLTNRTYN